MTYQVDSFVQLKSDPVICEQRDFTPNAHYQFGTQWGTPYSAPYTCFVVKGDNIPGWRSLIASGQNATTYLHGERIIGNIAPRGRIEITWERTNDLPFYPEKVKVIWDGNMELWETLAHPGDVDIAIEENARTIAAEHFISRARDAQRAVMSLVSLGEIGETVRNIKRPAESLFQSFYNYLDSVKKRTKRDRNKSRKRKDQIISDTWLEYAFGWRPLMADIQGAADAAARLNTHSPPDKVISGFGQESNSYSENHLRGGHYTTIQQRVTVTNYARCRFVGCISVKRLDTFETDVLGLSLRDVVPSLWELIPYSFLYEYFTNVGSIIDYLSLRETDIRWAWYGKKIGRKHNHHSPSVTADPMGGYGPGSVNSTCGQSTISREVVQREAFSGIPFPFPRFKIPGTSTKWLNIAALLNASSDTSRIVNRY